MLTQLAQFAHPLLTFPVIQQIRRNHGLEHATLHVLSARVKGLRMAGRSDSSGFILLGGAPTEQVEKAVHDALGRMRQGEHTLAIHPNCGTNLVTGGVLTSLAALVCLSGLTLRLTGARRIGWLMPLMMSAVYVSQPLGMALQKHFTTDGDPGDLEVLSVTRSEHQLPLLPAIVLHTVVTRARGAG